MLRQTLLASLMFLFTATLCLADDTNWPQWRGPKRDGLSTDTGLMKEWPQDGPPLLWEAKGAGRGYSSLAITGGKIFTMGDRLSTANDEDEYAVCFAEADGKPIWKTRLGKAWNNGQPSWQSSRSTPTVDGSLVFFLTPQADLIALTVAEGKEQWRKNLKSDFGGNKADGWGYSESVLIDGDNLICTPGGEKATIVSLNKKTGEQIWKASVPKDRGAGHASAVVAEVGGTRVYVQTTGGGALGVRAKDGVVLWTYPIDKATAVIPTPIVRGDLVFFSVGYNRGGALLKQVPNSDGTVKVEEIYGFKKDLNNKHGGVLLVGDYLFGDTNDSGLLWCAELMTGNVKWKGRGSGSGSAALGYADGHLYVRHADGTLDLVKVSPEKYEEVSKFKIPHRDGRPDWSHPVIAGGKLFLREGDWILCYNLRAK